MVARIRRARHRDLDGLFRDRLDHTKSALRLGVPKGRADVHAFTADAGNNEITVTGQEGLDGRRCVLTGDDLPVGLETGTLYWLAHSSGAVYTLRASRKSSQDVAFTDNGSDSSLTLI